MTLDTHIVVGSPDVHHASVYEFFRLLVVTPAEVEPEITEEEGIIRIDNPPGIGAYAWLMTKRNQDRSPFVHTCDEWCDDVVGERSIERHDGTLYIRTITAEDVESHDKYRTKNYRENGQGYIHISLDTAYSFHGKHPNFPELGVLSCTTLHVWLLMQFGVWMAEKYPEVPWWWQNEYTGDWFEKLDPEGVKGFVSSDFDRSMWFECTIKPALTKMVGEAGLVLHGMGSEIPKEEG